MTHEAAIVGASYLENKDKILTWSKDGTACLWKASNGTLVGDPMFHEKSVLGAKYLKERNQILTWSEDHTIRLWSASDGTSAGEAMKHELEGWEELHRLSKRLDFGPSVKKKYIQGSFFVGESDSIFSWCSDGTTYLWSASSCKLSLGPNLLERPVVEATYLSEIDTVITLGRFSWEENHRMQEAPRWGGSRTNGIHLWNPQDWNPSGNSMKQEDLIGIEADTKSNRILSWGNESTIRVWDIASSNLIAQIEYITDIKSIDYDSNHERILVVSEDGMVGVCDLLPDENISFGEYFLEFEVRSATNLNQDGSIRGLPFDEWREKHGKYLRMK